MRKSILWLAVALGVTLVLVAGGTAQPPGKRKGGPDGRPGKRGQARGQTLEQTVAALKLSDKDKETATTAVKAYKEDLRKVTELARAGLLMKVKDVLTAEEYKKVKEVTARAPRGPIGVGRGRGRGTAEDLVERLMAFDKNKDGKVTRDELPERLHDLLDKGDLNKDGALDREEIEKLARYVPQTLDQTVAALKLSDKNKETVTTAAKAYKENVQKLNELVRSELMLKMSEILSKEDLRKVKTALDRPVGLGDRPFAGRGPGRPPVSDNDGPGPGRGGPGGVGRGGPQPGQVLPEFVQDRLNLTAEQKKQLAEFQKEADARLAKILTKEQKEQLAEMRQRGPGGPGGRGRGGPPARDRRDDR